MGFYQSERAQGSTHIIKTIKTLRPKQAGYVLLENVAFRVFMTTLI